MPGPGSNEVKVETVASKLQPVLQLLSDASATNWSSELSIDSIVTKGLAVVAVWHPGLNVAQWEPVIIGASLAAVVIEQGIRNWRKTKSTVTALKAVQTALEAAHVITAPSTTTVVTLATPPA